MIYLVDTVEVDSSDAPQYLDTFESDMVPLMKEAGATLEHCRSSSAELGEPVTVQTTWSFSDFPTWNTIRRNLVLDPRWYACAEVLAGLRRGGTRRFYPGAVVPEAGTEPGR